MENDEIKTITSNRDSAISLVLALALLAGVAGIVGAITGAAAGYVFDSPHIWKFAVSGLALGLLFAFVFAFRKLFFLIEAWLRLDLNGDGYVGQPGQNQGYEPPQTEYLTPIWLENDTRNEGAGRTLTAEIPTPRDDTLARMAVILMVNGWAHFTQDNLTTDKKGTKVMTRKHWDEKFLPEMVKARLVRYKNGVDTRQGVELTESGKRMFTSLAGRAGEQRPALEPSEPLPAYAKDIPYPTNTFVDLSHTRKTRQ